MRISRSKSFQNGSCHLSNETPARYVINSSEKSKGNFGGPKGSLIFSSERRRSKHLEVHSNRSHQHWEAVYCQTLDKLEVRLRRSRMQRNPSHFLFKNATSLVIALSDRNLSHLLYRGTFSPPECENTTTQFSNGRTYRVYGHVTSPTGKESVRKRKEEN